MSRKPPPKETAFIKQDDALSPDDEPIFRGWMHSWGEQRAHVNVDEAQRVWEERKIQWANNEETWAQTLADRDTENIAYEEKERQKQGRSERTRRKADRVLAMEENEEENIWLPRFEAKRKVDESMPKQTTLRRKKGSFLAGRH